MKGGFYGRLGGDRDRGRAGPLRGIRAVQDGARRDSRRMEGGAQKKGQ